MVTQTNQLKKAEATPSERFTVMVEKEYSGHAGTVSLTNSQKRLIQNYFIAVDMALQTAEVNRLKKKEAYRDKTPVTWANVNMKQLAINVVSSARMTLDPVLPNQINMVPYKNNSTGLYDIGFIIGYRGKEVFAKKFGYDPPDHIIVELVYTNDVFEPIKKDKDSEVETYSFKVKKPFDRGAMIGGFYYQVFNDDPSKNKLVTWSKAEIDKRKPKYASTEFWGGEKPVYDSEGKKTNKTETVDGWYEEMARKTLFRAAWGDITIDSQKIDDDFIKLSVQEAEHQLALQSHNTPEDEANQNANKEVIDTDFEDMGNEQPEVKPENSEPENNEPEQSKATEPEKKDPQPEKKATEKNKAKNEPAQPQRMF